MRLPRPLRRIRRKLIRKIAVKPPAKMSYEEHVYLAKLAEQAERYEGEPLAGHSSCMR